MNHEGERTIKHMKNMKIVEKRCKRFARQKFASMNDYNGS